MLALNDQIVRRGTDEIQKRTRSSGLVRKHVDAVDTEFACCLLFRCRAETVKPRRDVHVFEADPSQIVNELCLRQSAGDSTGPKIDIAEGIVREFDIQDNVGKVQSTAGL